jgi:hypothetical protein
MRSLYRLEQQEHCAFHSEVASILPRLNTCLLTIYFIDCLSNYLF